MAFQTFQNIPSSLGSLQDDMNQLFARIYHGGLSTRPFDGQQWSPTVDLCEHADRFTLHVELPGVDPSETDVSCIGSRLTIRGKKTRPIDLDDDNAAVQSERRFGGFCRVIDLPGEIDADKISARSHGGVLEITIPKPESSRPRSVRVEVQDRP